MSDPEIDRKVQAMTQRLAARIKARGQAFCMSCMRDTKAGDVASIGVYFPKDPAITGKTRLVAYPVCLDCMVLPADKMAQAVEGNIIRSGLMIDTRNFDSASDA